MQNLLNTLHALGIQLSLSDKGDSLNLQAPKGVLTDSLRASIAQHKPALIRMLQRAGIDADEHTIVPEPERQYEPFALTDVQHAYWMGRQSYHQLGGCASHYYLEYDSEGLDLERLERALQKLVEHHGMLRAQVGDGLQKILPSVAPYQIEVSDVRGCSLQAQEAAMLAMRERMSHQMFAADRVPLFEVCAVRVSQVWARMYVSWDLLVVDTSSLQLLFTQWKRFYDEPDWSPAPLSLTFRDYVIAELAQQTSVGFERAKSYWLTRLDTLPPGPDLPLCQGAGQLEQSRFTRRRGVVERSAWQGIKAQAKALGCTPSVVLVAAFSEVLRGWARQSDFCLNLTLFNRQNLHPEVAELVGDFTSLNILQLSASSGLNFAQRAQAVQQQLAADLDHAAFGGLKVLRELGKQRGNQAANMPVVFSSTLGHHMDAASLNMNFLGEEVYGISQTPQLWLDHQVFENQGALVFNWDSVKGIFPEDMLDAMFECYQDLLQRLADDTACWAQPQELVQPVVQGLVQLTQRQLALRAKVNATAQDLPLQMLHQPFAKQAALTPEAIALASGGMTLSYARLNAYACRVARRLLQCGVQRNTLVAVVLDKGWEQIAAVLGVLYAGAAYLPIDPRQPLARRQQLLELGQVQVAVVHDSASAEYGAGYTLVAVDDKQTLAQDPAPLAIEQHLDDLAYVIFTSGSTGQPKGVMIDHQGAINTVLDMNQRFAVTAQDVVLSVSALNFDLSVYDIFGVLGAGGTLVLPEPERLTDPAHWNELMRRHGVTLWNSVPALLQIWLDYVQASAIKADPRLRMAWLSGDWIPVKLPDQAHAVLPELQLISLGGATEASIWSIYYPISQVGADWASIPYGKPLANQTMHVLNAQMQDCPMWAEGDIYIGGMGLAKGYWGDAEKTQERFIVHPHTGHKLYKTGDLGRYLPDGNIEFLGRSDYQVKLNGYRVELGEIAAQLRKQPGVQEAFVTVTEPEGGRKKQLVAYVVAQTGVQLALEQADLRTALAQLLPEYMVPYHYVVLERLPLSANGKVDVRQLPQLQTQEADAKPVQPPRNDTETLLHRMWTGVFSRSDFGVTDNFFDLGGNSLDVVGVATKVQASYGLQQVEQRELLQYFFEQPTIEGLAARVDAWMAEREEDMQLV